MLIRALELPTDPMERLTLSREMNRMRLTNNPLIGWLDKQLSIMDVENRTEFEPRIHVPRQGAAIAISQILDFINNSQKEVSDLEGKLRS